MDKFCVFCGRKPEAKNKEHIIPQWLIEKTGNPKRQAFFGFDFASEKPTPRTYAFDSFVFPACEKCNFMFSLLESNAQSVIIAILNGEKLDALDIIVIMDWLDKVRVGLWLAFFYLNNNVADISPAFHIRSRIGTRDRFLVIYELETHRSGINFVGVETPTFQNNPTCFALLINNYCFFNGSNINLCDRRLGFPYSKESFYKNFSQIEIDVIQGLHRRLFPVVRKSFIPFGTKLFQPIFKEQMTFKDAIHLYDTPYIRDNSIDWDSGQGKIFQELNGTIDIYPINKTLGWRPTSIHSFPTFLPKLNESVYDFQLYMMLSSASTERLSKDDQLWFKKNVEGIRMMNALHLKFIKENTKNIFE